MGSMIELSELQDAASKAFPADQLRPERDAAWQLAAEMGWLMIDLPEDQGGLGLGRDAAATIHYELGKVLSSAPLIPGLKALVARNTGNPAWNFQRPPHMPLDAATAAKLGATFDATGAVLAAA